MSVQARIVGSREELGPLSEDGLVIFGHRLTRDWSDIDPTPDHLAKLSGNRHVEVKGAPAPKAAAGKTEPDHEPAKPLTKGEASARLTELGVSFDPRAPVGELREAVAAAEAAAAEAGD